MIQKKSDDAISPVIGVMLMLVVTVVIAAAVTIFATGVVGETEAAPVAVLDVEIISNQETLVNLKGPELFITHLSGDQVDTGDIELRFSWSHDTVNQETSKLEQCSHYSTYSAEGFKKSNANLGRPQALYVKSTMPVDQERTEYGSGTTGNLDHYFGDVILTPGLKLSAHSEFLENGQKNTHSKYMDVIFDNYKISTTLASQKEHKVQKGYAEYASHDSSTCDACQKGWICNDARWRDQYLAYSAGKCYDCNHDYNLCTKEKDPNFTCACAVDRWDLPPTMSGGIMNHLPPGTAVDVMIIHLPSNKAIYDKTVIVQ